MGWFNRKTKENLNGGVLSYVIRTDEQLRRRVVGDLVDVSGEVGMLLEKFEGDALSSQASILTARDFSEAVVKIYSFFDNRPPQREYTQKFEKSHEEYLHLINKLPIEVMNLPVMK
ncbi:MAG: hypothetical protein ABIA78_03160 [archaeon]